MIRKTFIKRIHNYRILVCILICCGVLGCDIDPSVNYFTYSNDPFFQKIPIPVSSFVVVETENDEHGSSYSQRIYRWAGPREGIPVENWIAPIIHRDDLIWDTPEYQSHLIRWYETDRFTAFEKIKRSGTGRVNLA